jgi:hypothetical protein
MLADHSKRYAYGVFTENGQTDCHVFLPPKI